MSRILKRPMFRRGGKVNEGIMSGIVDRTKHAENPFVGNINRERLKANTQAITELLEEFAPVAKTRLPIGQFGLNLASGMTVTDALKDPYASFTKADDIRRAQIAKRGQGALSTALKMELAKGKGVSRVLSKEEVKKQFPELPDNTIVQVKDGEYKFDKPDAASVKKSADLKSTIGLLNRVEGNYEKLGKPVGGFAGFGFDIDRIKGQTGRLFGTEKGRDYATLVADIDKTTTFLTQAISGAAVSEQEAKRIRALIPQLDDTEVVFEAKLKSLRSYLGDAVKNYGGDVEALMKAGDANENLSAKNYSISSKKNLEDMTDDELEAYRDLLLTQEQQP